MKHIDLFSGIGGFALAVDTVWPNSTHIFCEIDPFCQKVLSKHWPQSKIYEDIRSFTNTNDRRSQEQKQQATGDQQRGGDVDILTGGFPCQPFSQAGQRRGTEDNRFLWPEMRRVIQEFKPTWVIAENVSGILTIEQGMVFEQVCLDLEGAGYEVQPFIIPAVAVNAPHRRDRVWFVAHRNDSGGGTFTSGTLTNREEDSKEWQHAQPWTGGQDLHATNATSERSRGVASEECGIDKRKLEQKESQGSALWREGEGCSCNATHSESERGQCRESREPREPTQLREKFPR